jgi:hypothetical protein
LAVRAQSRLVAGDKTLDVAGFYRFQARRLQKPVLHSIRNGFSVALYQPSPTLLIRLNFQNKSSDYVAFLAARPLKPSAYLPIS